MSITRNDKQTKNPMWKLALCGLAVAFALARCETQVAGTSVGTGNPTEIQVSFKNDSGSMAVTGPLSVYASTQIPVPGFSPGPMVSLPVTGTTHATLTVQALATLADSLWPKTSVENGLYKFNIVVTGENHGVILKGLSFKKKDGVFVLRDEDSKSPRTGTVAAVEGAMTPLVLYQGVFDSTTMSANWDYHLFLYGTGFTGKGDGGRFTIPKLPFGQYESHMVLIPSKSNPASGIGNVDVYKMTSLIEPGKKALTIGAVQSQVPLPDALKTK